MTKVPLQRAEVFPVNARAILILATAVASFAAGCGESPTAVFVPSDQTKGMMREAQKSVQAALDESFGTPKNLVAWRKLPVDFGQIEGTVSAADPNAPFEFEVTLKPQEGAAQPPQITKGAGLLWISGDYKDVKYQTTKGNEGYIQFHVEKYDEATGRLTVSTIPQLGPGEQKPPAAGNEFVILGPVLQHGRKLYMTNCLHCHGVSGDGNGPTARYLNPLPRDYRLGIFKFTSTTQTDKASRDDLGRIIRQGIPGTYMPSFMLLKDDELHALVEYVRWLALRGELERKMNVELEAGGFTTAAMRQRVKDGESEDAIEKELATYLNERFAATVDEAAGDLADVYHRAEEAEAVIVPKKKRTPDDLASRARGRELFLSAKAKCATCHGPLGHGDGPQTEDFQLKEGSNDKYPVPGLHDDWGHPIKPRNLTTGIYRGGRRPIDIYRRIYAGIKGAKMPAFGGTVLNDDEIWDIVNYVLSIPYDGPIPAAPSGAGAEKTAGGAASDNVAAVGGKRGN